MVELATQVETESNAIMAACYRHTPPLPIRTMSKGLDHRMAVAARDQGLERLDGCDHDL